jgi:hypothetical protein
VSRAVPLRLALAVGLITAAGTAGALLGFGARAGTPARPFNTIARAVFGPGSADVWGFDPRVSLTGVALHVTAMLLYGVAFTATGARRGWKLVAAALAVSLAALAIELALLPRLTWGLSALLVPGELLVLHLVMAACLALGMRFALDGPRNDA